MTDRELLENAAKAAGICLHPKLSYSYGNWGCDTTCMVCKQDPSEASWNPLTSDRDALRLAVKLGIQVCWWPSLGYATAHYDYGSSKREEYGSDPYAATRRAIVRAAAEIGRKV